VNLVWARTFGYAVPAFFLLRYSAIKRAVDGGNDDQLAQVAQFLIRRLALSDGDTIAVRSSSVLEDQAVGSRAGEFKSVLDVSQPELVGALKVFVAKNGRSRSGESYNGAVLIQQMVKADYGGVCLTSEERINGREVLVVEISSGSNEKVTSGSVVPGRIMIDRQSGDILEDLRENSVSSLEPPDVRGIVEVFLDLERRFGRAVDIEWAYVRHQIYILQVRPIARPLS
jgi:pyruvate,water dikinase